MNRRELKARDKTVVKSTRDGLVERNMATGEDNRVSKREASIDLRTEKPVRESFSQGRKGSGINAKRKTINQHRRGNDYTRQKTAPVSAPGTQSDNAIRRKRLRARDKVTMKNTRDGIVEHNAVTGANVRISKREENHNLCGENIEQVHYNSKPEVSSQTHSRLTAVNEKPSAQKSVSYVKKAKRKKQVQQYRKSEYAPEIKAGAAVILEKTPVPEIKTEAASTLEKPSAPKPAETKNTKAEITPKLTDAQPVSAKPDKLQFKPDEKTPEAGKITRNKRLDKAQTRVDKALSKLEKAQGKIPAKKKLKKVSVVNEKSGKLKKRLHFEKTPVSQAEHIKGTKPLRPVKFAGNALALKAHAKVFQVENENVAVKAAHRAEMVVEGGVRTALRFKKTAPYRKAAKLQRVAQKKSAKLSHQKVLAENPKNSRRPKLKSNVFKHAMQKRRIKRDYAKAAHKAQKSVKKGGSLSVRAGNAITRMVTRNPKVIIILAIFLLILCMIMSLVGSCGSAFSSSVGGTLLGSFLTNDAEIDKIVLAYTEWETDLQIIIGNIEKDNPGYDEYVYDIAGDIGQCIFEILAYLTASHQNFTFDEISEDLEEIFNKQYDLILTPSVKILYKTVKETDPQTGEEYEVEEPYEWHILTITLIVECFNNIAAENLGDEQFIHYSLLAQSGGGRQIVDNPLGLNWLPYVSSGYGYRIHPISEEKDLHRGVDIEVAAGTLIVAAQVGTVIFAGYTDDFGNVVIITNDGGIGGSSNVRTVYARCESILVYVGQTVSVSDIIATTGEYLHFEVLKGSQYLNPIIYARS
jgi:murein DD-endopeptidase MepM/ murein hydrolase activator NlpD